MMLRCSVLVFDAPLHRPNPPRYDGRGHARTLHNGFRVDSRVCFDDQAKAKKSSVFQFDRPKNPPEAANWLTEGLDPGSRGSLSDSLVGPDARGNWAVSHVARLRKP